jgi:hypothetical protein
MERKVFRISVRSSKNHGFKVSMLPVEAFFSALHGA